MGVFIQMDNINDFDRNNQKMVWNKIKQAFSGRDAVGYSSYPLLNKTGLTCIDDLIIILDKTYGIIAIDVKDYNIKDIAKVGKKSWIINSGITKTLNPKLQSKYIFNNFTIQFNMDKDLRSNFRGNYFLVLPNISENEWIERGYKKETSDINIIFKEDIDNNMLISKLTKINTLEIEENHNKAIYLKASKIINENHNQNIKDYITIDTLTAQGPININSIACKW